MKEYLDRSLEKLTPMEKTIVRSRFGLDDDDPLTLREVGEKLRLSRERIRQIEEKALRKLREELTGQFSGRLSQLVPGVCNARVPRGRPPANGSRIAPGANSF